MTLAQRIDLVGVPWLVISDELSRAPNGGYACASSASGGSGASWAERIAGGMTAPPSPAAVPTGSGLSPEGPSDLFWRG
jgi:hypothetical protein